MLWGLYRILANGGHWKESGCEDTERKSNDWRIVKLQRSLVVWKKEWD